MSDADAATITGGSACSYYANHNCPTAGGCLGVPTNYANGDESYGQTDFISCGTISGACNNNFMTMTWHCMHGG